MSGYRCVVADPPWPVRWAGTNRQPDGRGRGGYNFASVDEITEIMREQLQNADADCHLWLWATTGTLPQALGVMESLGFRYVSQLVCVKWHKKLQIGLGHYLRNSHELCLLGVRGQTQYPKGSSVPSVIFSPRTRHSRKPGEAFAVFERVSPSPRLELFARGSRAGWDVWGDESIATPTQGVLL
jgi:N6-adenosine-specific RNA methylase IME4